MKWVTILSFVVLLSLTESRILQKRDHHEGHPEGQEHHDGHPEGHHVGQEHHDGHPEEHHEGHPKGHHEGQVHHEGHAKGHHGIHHAESHMIGEVYKMMGEDNFEAVAMAVFSQSLQMCPFEEHVQRVKNVEEIAEKCSKGAKITECAKSAETVLVDEMCKTPENKEKYPYHEECCAKSDHERHACFESHKLTGPNDLPPYQKKDPEQTCKSFHEDKKLFIGRYIHELARRKCLMYSPAILAFAEHFEEITSECCKDIAHSAACFDEKMPPLKKEIKIAYALQQHSCYVQKEFGDRALKALKLAIISQKMPKASLQNVVAIVHDIVHLTESCCRGDMMECMADRLALSNKVCEKKDELSSKLKECCEKDVIERSACIVKMDYDDKPADLSQEIREFIDDSKVCQKYKDKKDNFLAEFTHAYARRHSELAAEQILRIALGYEEYLKKCCGEEDVPACLGHAENAMKEAIKADQELLKKRCDGLEKLGPFEIEKQLAVKYTLKMPQMSTSSLIELVENMALTGEKCCKLPAEKQMSCSEAGLSLTFAHMCQNMEGHKVNDQVSHCCKDCYSGQRPCFTKMGADKSYVPPAPSAEHFHFTDALCDTADKEALEKKKLTFLVNLIKAAPGISQEQMDKITPEFSSMVEHCCKADNHNACFTEEGRKLIHRCEIILHLHVAEDQVAVQVAA